MNSRIVFPVLSITTLVGYLALAVMFPRELFWENAGIYYLLFTIYLFLVFVPGDKINIKVGIGLAMAFRLAMCFSIPVFSDDFYRFVWDGHLLVYGINPYQYLPSEAIDFMMDKNRDFFFMLLDKMNSPDYHSVYTPVNQLFFWISAKTGGEHLLSNILLLRLVLFGFEFLNFYFLLRIFKIVRINQRQLWLYAFNPLIIVEVFGNLHFELMVLTGMLGTLYALLNLRQGIAGAWWSWGIAIKLTPLMFGPLLIKYAGKKSWVNFFVIASIVSGISFLPLLWDGGWFGFLESIKLFQGKFEFNASGYYIFRQIGYWLLGYNIIGILSPMLSLLSFGIIVSLALINKKRDVKQLMELILITYLVYFLLQPVVHPWYIIPALGISVLTCKKSFLVWSGLVFLSYHAYSNVDFQENPWILCLEYGLLIITVAYDYHFKGKLGNHLPRAGSDQGNHRCRGIAKNLPL